MIFERNNRLGGDIWTLPRKHGADNITRELGAAFLSPDYAEVRALLRRFGLTEQPIDVKTMMRFHTSQVLPNGTDTERVESPMTWYTAWVAKITGITDPTAQKAAVGSAIQR